MMIPDTGSLTGSEEPRPRPTMRSLMQYAAVVAGGVLLALGWYGISGTADVSQQIPYLASASIPGVGLVVAGAVLLASDRSRRSNEDASEMVAALYRLLADAVEAPAAGGAAVAGAEPATSSGTGIVTVVDGTRFHRPDCALVQDKPGVEPVSAEQVAARQLRPCPICEPTITES